MLKDKRCCLFPKFSLNVALLIHHLSAEYDEKSETCLDKDLNQDKNQSAHIAYGNLMSKKVEENTS